MTDNRWLIYALVAAIAAALTNIFAKIGMEGINPTAATTVRGAIMFIFLLVVCAAQDLWHHIGKIRGWPILWIVLSAIAGATSWLFGFKALAAGGKVTQVMPIDKLSVPLAAVLAYFLLRDRPAWWNWAGILLITFGAYLTALPQKPGAKLPALPEPPTNRAADPR